MCSFLVISILMIKVGDMAEVLIIIKQMTNKMYSSEFYAKRKMSQIHEKIGAGGD